MRRISRFIRIIVIDFVVFSLILLVGELWARQILPVAYTAQDRLPAYTESSYWTPDYGLERQASDHTAIDADGFVKMADFTGRWINIRDHMRVTTDQSARYQHTIWMLGNSALLDSYVPDEFTIASYLQRQSASAGYRVINLGVSGVSAINEIARLKAIALQPGDVVIFYFATNEVNSIYSASLEDPGPVCYLFRKTGLSLLRLICGQNRAPTKLSQADWVDPFVAKNLEDYSQTLLDARKYIEEHQAVFINVIPPYLFSRILTSAERDLLKHPEAIFPAQDTFFPAEWPALVQAANIVSTVDLTHVLDTIREHRSVYFDVFHCNEVGNEIIADALYRYIIW